MDHFDQRDNVLVWRIGKNPMAEVEDVAGTAPCLGQHTLEYERGIPQELLDGTIDFA